MGKRGQSRERRAEQQIYYPNTFINKTVKEWQIFNNMFMIVVHIEFQLKLCKRQVDLFGFDSKSFILNTNLCLNRKFNN